MLIGTLNTYYDILERGNKIPSEKISVQRITHIIMLKKDGTITDIIDCREESEPNKKGKTKKNPINVNLPKRTEKPGIDLNIIEHRPLYIFGLNYDKKTGEFSENDRTNKAKKSHECFISGNLEFTEGMTSDIVTAYRNFISNWIPENERENEKLQSIAKDYLTSSLIFALDGHPEITLHDPDGEIMRKVMSQKKEIKADGICSITGKPDEIARTHDKIKGIRGGQASGGLVVCYNNKADESYGKEQSYNSSVGYTAMKHYTAALNSLTADEHHHMYLEDLTIVFWAMSLEDRKETDIFEAFFEQRDTADTDKINSMIENAAKNLAERKTTDLSSFGVDENTMFYIAGLAPNNSRISQKFIYRNKFGTIFNNAVRHQSDMLIEGGKKAQIPMWQICASMKSPKSNKEKISPPMLSALFSAIINNAVYPAPMLETLIRRVKTDKSVSYVQAGLIKAFINRKLRMKNKEEEIKMALDKNNTNASYLCGRLFAVLEKIQRNVYKDLNRTIKDAFFASACAKPSAVFPRLMVLVQYHLAKEDDKQRFFDNKLIGEIADKIGTKFPSTLSMEEQGRFILGYYQQTQDLYKPRKKESEETETNN